MSSGWFLIVVRHLLARRGLEAHGEALVGVARRLERVQEAPQICTEPEKPLARISGKRRTADKPWACQRPVRYGL